MRPSGAKSDKLFKTPPGSVPPLVGGYLPPSDKAGDAQRLMTAAIRAVPDGARLMVLGDLNADLDSPRGRQEDVLAAEASEHDLVCATK